MVTFNRRASSVWLPFRGRRRGPDGTRVPPHTPAYTATATTSSITTAAGLQTALNACTGGEVLEVTADLTTAFTLTSVAALAALSATATNVLIRPPVGQRHLCAGAIIDCPHVVFAGFTFVSGFTGGPVEVSGSHSYFWRCVDESLAALWQVTTDASETIEDQGLIECVWPIWHYNSTSDVLRIGAGTSSQNRRAIMDGCYVAPKIAGIYLPSSWTNGGTFSNPGQPINFTKTGAITVQSGIAVTTLGSSFAFGPPSAALLAWLDIPPTDGTPVTVEIRIGGVLWQTITLDASRENRWRKFRSSSVPTVNRNWTAGEVITANVTQAGAGARGLHLLVGVDAEAGPAADGPDLHPDVLQFFASGGSMPDMVLRDSLFGPSNGKTFQVANITGDVTWDNVWAGRIPGGSAHQFGVESVNMREFVVDCDFQLDIAFQTTSTVPLGLRNRAASFSGTKTLDASNIVADVGAFPDPPDLAAVWPDCPYTPPVIP